MVLVVDPPLVEDEIEAGLGHPPEEVGLREANTLHRLDVCRVFLVHSDRHQVVQVREEVVVENELGTLALIVARLVRRELLADIHDSALDRSLARGARRLLEVLHHEGQDVLLGRDGLDNRLLGLEPEREHEVHELEMAGNGWKRDLEQVLLVPLDHDECPVPAILREDLRDVDPLVVPLGELSHDLVRREVLEGHEDALGAVDDEVAPRIQWILAVEYPLGVAHAGQVARGRADHYRQQADGRDDGLLVLAALNEGHVELHRGRVGQVAKTGFAREEVALGAVGLPDERLHDPDLAKLDPDGLVRFPAVLDIRLDDPLLGHDLLQVMGEKVVERVQLVPGHVLMGEICF